MTAKLVILAGPRCGETVSIEANETTIGRDARNHLNIPDHLMSRRHCVVELSEAQCTLRDLGSANGTYVNGMPVRERTLAHGDRIRVGDSVLMFLRAGAQPRAQLCGWAKSSAKSQPLIVPSMRISASSPGGGGSTPR